MRKVGKKLGSMLLTIVLVSFLVYASFEFIPGDQATAMLGIEATPESVAQLQEELGLNRPFIIRFVDWGISFLQGDMGYSYSYNMSVSTLLAQKFVITLTLTILAFLMVIVVSVPISLVSAKYSGRILDRLIQITNQITMAIPPFFLGILLTYVFGLLLKVFVPGNYISYDKDLGEYLRYLIFPAIAIAMPKCAMTIQLLRSAIEKERHCDYIRTAYSKGNTTNRVLVTHVLQNAMLPVVTFLGMVATEMLVGSIIIEQVFGIPGIGSILLQAIGNRDYALIQGVIVCLACWVLLIQAGVEFTCQCMDPRTKQGLD